MTPAIELESLTKQFGDVTALESVDLAVEEGEIFGFLGPNGAGKSTTIDILLDFIRPTSGSARVLGMDAQANSLDIRQRTGVLSGSITGAGPWYLAQWFSIVVLVLWAVVPALIGYRRYERADL
jgi:ABC-type multidrug transport system ATPase subunit